MLPARASAVALAFLGMHASVAWGASSSLRAVKINGSPILPSSNIVAAPGDRVEVEIRIWGWDADLPGSLLSAYRVVIDGRRGYTSGSSGLLLPAGWDAPPDVFLCGSDGDCPADQPTCFVQHNPRFDDLCGASCPCQPEYPVCASFGGCVGVDHDLKNLGRYAFVDIHRSDFVFPLGGVGGVSVVSSVNYTYGGAALFGPPTLDTGPLGAWYAGTLTLDIPSDAGGEFTIGTVLGTAPNFDSLVVLEPPPPATPDPNHEIRAPLATAMPLRINVIASNSVIPTVSTWGLVALCLTLLVGAKVVFSRRTPQTS